VTAADAVNSALDPAKIAAVATNKNAANVDHAKSASVPQHRRSSV
jgi:hypothetical protein